MGDGAVNAVNSSRIPLEQLQARVCGAGAELMAGGGFDALSPSAVAERAGLSKSQVERAYSNRPMLAAGIYVHAHARVRALCGRHPRRGASGVDAVIALVYDLVEQARVDPLVRAVHILEGTEHATESGLDSVYLLWGRQLVDLLVRGGDLGPDEMVSGARYSQVEVAVGVLVDAVAGFSSPCRPGDVSARLDRVHMLLTVVLPTLCIDTGVAAHLRQYLSRVREYAYVGAE